nr:sulfatase-like hydrolase/transferase [Streptomyces sp. CBMA123]
MPTLHGFDEFFGNLYHLNAEEEPEERDYPSEEEYPDFRRNYGPRGVLHTWADGHGGQRIENTGPLTRERMKTCDEEFASAAGDFIRRQAGDDVPFFLWFNTTHMHFRTHVKDASLGQSGRWQSEYHDAMIDHDKLIGVLLDLLDELGIAENTIVVYGTDNGPHANTWPDAATTPFRSEKNSNWEGGFRTPALVRWPGHIPAGVVSNEIVAGLDWLPTFAAAAGEPKIADKLKAGTTLDGQSYKVHLDGHNLLPYLTGQSEQGPRREFFYFSDDGDLMALRYDNWKLIFMEQRSPGTMALWAEPFTVLRVPKLFNLRTDPFEKADVTANTYYDWFLAHAFLLVPAQRVVADFLSTFKEFPPRQKAGSFTIDQVLANLVAGMPSA